VGPRVVVVGAGIAGLAVTYEILERAERLAAPLDLRCLEASGRSGGNIRTSQEQGFLCEWGATGFPDDAPATVTLVRRLGLEGRLVQARAEAARRFVFRAGKLRELPLGPWKLVSSQVLSPLGTLRLLCEPLIPRRRSPESETVHGFAARRIGPRAADVLVDAMVSGVYAGDARALELETAFPSLHEMERQHGSLFRALLARRKLARAGGPPLGGPAGPAGRLTSFADGMQELVQAVARPLGPRLVLDTPVLRLSDMGSRGFRVHVREGAPLDVDAVVLACPAWQAGPIVRAMDGELARALDHIPSAGVAVVHLGYRRDAIGPHPDGFGFLVPRGQGPRILGALWPASIFAGRAPEDSLLLTVMAGGARDPAFAALTDAQMLDVVRADLRAISGIRADPSHVRIVRHARGIPQYTIGHRRRLALIDRRLAGLPGLWLAGNSLRGVSINSCVADAPVVAEAVLEFLAARSTATTP